MAARIALPAIADPLRTHRLGRLLPGVEVGAVDAVDRRVALQDGGAADLVPLVPLLAKIARQRRPAIVVNDLLQLRRQGVILGLVHNEQQHTGIDGAIAAKLAYPVRQLIELERDHGVIRKHHAVDHPFCQCFRHAWRRDAERLCPQHGERVVGLPIGRAQLQALAVLRLFQHHVLGKKDTAAECPDRERLHVFQFLTGKGFEVFPDRRRGPRTYLIGQERHLQHLEPCEAARCGPGHRPNDVDHAVARLIV